MVLPKDFKKYKWFVTSSGKIVVGGKSAEQNDLLLKEITEKENDFVVMHTSHPGSPFSVILSTIPEVSKEDLEECAIFTGCFSRAWKDGKEKTQVHIFRASQLEKKRGMKAGTWGVNKPIENVSVDLTLVLTKQKNVYRAVPPTSAKKVLLTIAPGKKDKTIVVNDILKKLNEKPEKKDEILAALPAGGISIKS